MDERHYISGPQTLTLTEEPPEKRPESQPRVVHETRAAALLGVSAEKLRRLSSETGLGRAEREGRDEVVFTYAELYRLCRSAVMVAD
jgi:hypothetical protein